MHNLPDDRGIFQRGDPSTVSQGDCLWPCRMASCQCSDTGEPPLRPGLPTLHQVPRAGAPQGWTAEGIQGPERHVGTGWRQDGDAGVRREGSPQLLAEALMAGPFMDTQLVAAGTAFWLGLLTDRKSVVSGKSVAHS